MREILQYPAKELVTVCADITNIDSYIKELSEEMQQHLQQPYVCGLAAPQLGECVRLICVKYGIEILVLVNPVKVKLSSDFIQSTEACMSINNSSTPFTVKRYKRVKVEALNIKGELVHYKGCDLFGRVLQHEIDHLNGITLFERSTLSYE